MALECMTCEHHQYYSGGACLCHHGGHQHDEHYECCIELVDTREDLQDAAKCAGYEKKKWAPYPEAEAASDASNEMLQRQVADR